MVLHVDSEAVYLIMTESRICYPDHFYMSHWPSLSPIKPNPERDDTVHTECKTIRNVVSSSAEAETCGTFNNRKTAIGMRPALIELEHKQTATPPKNRKFYDRRLYKLGDEI